MVKISIIVPVYNVEKYLEKCLDSILIQEFKEYEIICIDDCSTDSSSEILKKYQKKYSNIYVISNSINKGLSYGRNVGIQRANGKYLLFVDSDDWLIDKEVLGHLYTKAEYYQTDLLRYRLNLDKTAFHSNKPQEGKKCFVELVENNSYRWESVRNFVRREFIVNNSIKFDEKVYGCEDILFSTKCILEASRCLEIPDKFYFYNQHVGSITRSTVTNKNVEGILKTLVQLYNLFSIEDSLNAKYGLLKLIGQIDNMCWNILWGLNEKLSFKGWDDSIILLYENVFKEGSLLVYNEIFFNWDKILNTSHLYIYGAGKASEELWKHTMNRIHYTGIIVTQNTVNTSFWNGIKIYEVTDSAIDKSGLVLLSVTGAAREEIRKVLKQNNFSNVLVVGKA